MKSFNRIILAFALIAAAGFWGCSDATTSNNTTTVYGDALPLGKGTIRSVVVMDKDNKPTTLGVVFNDSALIGLPAVDSSVVVLLPASAAVAPYTHISCDWNVHGHDPSGIYDLPHFDFHFYTITQAERGMIAPGPGGTMVPGPDTVAVPAANIPKDYFTGGPAIAIPAMGVHWVDSLGREFKGSVFDYTFIFGFYKGSNTFLEPMITKAFLDTKTNVSASIKQPTSYAKAGYYPSAYSIKHDNAKGEYMITFDNLTMR